MRARNVDFTTLFRAFLCFRCGPMGTDQVFELGHERGDILELKINRSEAHVSDLIQRFKPPHYRFADIARRKFSFERILDVFFDLIGDVFELAGRDGSFFSSAEQSGHYLISVERFARTVLFHDHEWDLIDPFIRCEPPAAAKTFAPPPDRISVLRLARVDDLIFDVAAIGTTHN
jgi:hypothetical protein